MSYPAKIQLAQPQQDELERCAKGRTVAARAVERAKIILQSAAGSSVVPTLYRGQAAPLRPLDLRRHEVGGVAPNPAGNLESYQNNIIWNPPPDPWPRCVRQSPTRQPTTPECVESDSNVRRRLTG